MCVTTISVGDTGACSMTYPLKVKVTKCKTRNKLAIALDFLPGNFYSILASLRNSIKLVNRLHKVLRAE